MIAIAAVVAAIVLVGAAIFATVQFGREPDDRRVAPPPPVHLPANHPGGSAAEGGGARTSVTQHRQTQRNRRIHCDDDHQ